MLDDFTAKSWLFESMNFTGTGNIKFIDIEEYISGVFSINIDKYGIYTIKMIPDSDEAMSTILSHYIPKLIVKYNSFSIETDEFIISSININDFDNNFIILQNNEIILNFSSVSLENKKDEAIKFWCSSIYNLNHSFETCFYIDKKIDKYYKLIDNSVSIIEFEYENKLIYIQPFNNSNEIKTKLDNKIDEFSITSLMIGDINESINISSINSILIPLNLITGSNCYTNRIHFISENNNISKIIYTNLSIKKYICSHKYINHTYYINEFMNKFFNRNDNDLKIISSYLNKYIILDESIESEMIYLFRSFEILFTKYGIKNDQIHFSEEIKPEIIRILEITCIEIDKIENTEREFIESKRRLKNKITSLLNNKDWDTGEKVMRLLNTYTMNDHNIFNEITEGKPLFSNMISKYRNIVIHEGFINNSENFRELKYFSLHLLDILIRILLHEIDYDKEYIPYGTLYKIKSSKQGFDKNQLLQGFYRNNKIFQNPSE